MWDKHIKRSIGRREIAQLNPYEVERYFRRLKDEGTGRTTVKHIRAMLNRACRLARKWSANTLPNPVVDTELPVWPLGERGEPVRAPDLAEVQVHSDGGSGDHDERFGAFVRLVAATGVRRGEACALRWSDIDWESGTDPGGRVGRGGQRGSRGQGAEDQGEYPATRPRPGHTWRCFDRSGSSQESLAAMCEVAIGADGFVFSFGRGRRSRLIPDTMSHEFTKVPKRPKTAKDVHLHSLRHFQATALDRVVPERQKQARLGWATVHMARHYTGVIADEDLRAAEHIGRLLGGEVGADGAGEPQTGQESAAEAS